MLCKLEMSGSEMALELSFSMGVWERRGTPKLEASSCDFNGEGTKKEQFAVPWSLVLRSEKGQCMRMGFTRTHLLSDPSSVPYLLWDLGQDSQHL